MFTEASVVVDFLVVAGAAASGWTLRGLTGIRRPRRWRLPIHRFGHTTIVSRELKTHQLTAHLVLPGSQKRRFLLSFDRVRCHWDGEQVKTRRVVLNQWSLADFRFEWQRMVTVQVSDGDGTKERVLSQISIRAGFWTGLPQPDS